MSWRKSGWSRDKASKAGWGELLWGSLTGLTPEQTAQGAPYIAAGAEAYLNPTSFISSLGRNVSQPAKRELLNYLNLTQARAQMSGKQRTSAINMVYGKRRNYRSKSRSRSRAPTRKRNNRRKRVSGKKNNALSAIHKALLGRM